jgi:importin-7
MIGSISHMITKKGSPILGMMESFLVSHVFPEFRSPHGYMRARACEVLNRFSEIDFEDHNVLCPLVSMLIVEYRNGVSMYYGMLG